MAFYRVKESRTIQVSGVPYNAGQVVQLSDREAAYHAQSIEQTEAPPTQQSVAVFNFAIPNGSDLSHELGLGTKTLEISGYTFSNPMLIQAEAAHGLVTSDKVWVYASRLLNNQQENLINNIYPVTVVSPLTFTIPIDGTKVPQPDKGFIDYLENLASSTFTAKLYSPAISKIEHVSRKKAFGTIGERHLVFDGVESDFKPGYELSTGSISPEYAILSVNYDEEEDKTVVWLNTGLFSNVLNYVSAIETVLDFDRKGAFAQDIQIVYNPDTFSLNIGLPYNGGIGTYLYEVTEFSSGAKKVILRGLISYV
jgi:hypothetical protein